MPNAAGSLEGRMHAMRQSAQCALLDLEHCKRMQQHCKATHADCRRLLVALPLLISLRAAASDTPGRIPAVIFFAVAAAAVSLTSADHACLLRFAAFRKLPNLTEGLSQTGILNM